MAKPKGALVGIVLMFIAAIAAYNYFSKGKEDAKLDSAEAITVSGISNVFTEKITSTLNTYDSLRLALVKADTGAARLQAGHLAQQLSAIPFQEMQVDTTLRGLAEGLATNIAEQAKQVYASADIDGQRKAFQPLSDLLFDLLRTIQYNGSTVYQQHCPMAFDNTGANWLSYSKEIVNPYFGEKMLHCGAIQDSISFSR